MLVGEERRPDRPNRNSLIGTSLRKAAVSKSSTRMMPAVTRIEPAALRNSSAFDDELDYRAAHVVIVHAEVRAIYRDSRCSSVTWL